MKVRWYGVVQKQTVQGKGGERVAFAVYYGRFGQCSLETLLGRRS